MKSSVLVSVTLLIVITACGYTWAGVMLVAPNGGENWVAGNTESIEWETLGDANIPNVKLEYSTNNGHDWNDVNTVQNTGSYEWLVPEVTSSNQCLVRISDANDANVYDVSDDVFIIFKCQLSSPADLDNNCKIDFVDFSIWAQDWLRNGNPFDPNCTEHPEAMPLIPGGEFQMGDHHDGMSDALPVHAVYVDSFYMSRYEVTNRQYCDYLNSAYPGQIKVVSGVVYASSDVNNSYPYCNTYSYDAYSQIDYNGVSGTFSVRTKDEPPVDMNDNPIVQVSWYGAVAYCDYYGYRLPTEAEWEYAARGGEHSPYYRYPWGDMIDDPMANYWASNDPYETGDYPWTTPVGYYDGSQIPAGTDMANGYGLYDVAGNVWEWCNDWYDSNYYSVSPYDNPQGPASGTARVLRGGSWGVNANICRVAYRSVYDVPGSRSNSIGFRVVLDLE